MPRNIIVVNDGFRALSEILSGISGCTEVTWDGFSPMLLDPSRAQVIVLAGPAERFRRKEILNALAQDGHNRKVLVVLPPESLKEDIEFALSIADDLTLSSERKDLLELRVRRLLDSYLSDTDIAYEGLIRELGRANLVGKDPIFLRAAERMAASARTDLPVLITGETGTGKELFASAIHFLSHRRNGPFIPVDCGGIPEHLFENEIFGHVRGAYTDARAEQRGLAAAANGGTLFLDEVDSLPAAAQAKLLRFLQEKHFKPLGAEQWTRADVRIVAASNRDLAQLTAEKQFRQDLYFRLNVLRLEVPPLRERPQDIPLLARHFLALHQPAGLSKSFSPAALERLASHLWPGNVRELVNVVQRAIVFSSGAQINGCDIAFFETSPVAQQDFRTARSKTIESFERDYVQELLERHHGNVTQAARAAHKERRAFGRLVKKYGLQGGARRAGPI
jgi:DNA-binding NtrC family response regulator